MLPLVLSVSKRGCPVSFVLDGEFIFFSSSLELPQKKRLVFLCGVEVEVSFSALFSNVIVAFATVKKTGPIAQDCTVTLTSIPVSALILS